MIHNKQYRFRNVVVIDEWENIFKLTDLFNVELKYLFQKLIFTNIAKLQYLYQLHKRHNSNRQTDKQTKNRPADRETDRQKNKI